MALASSGSGPFQGKTPYEAGSYTEANARGQRFPLKGNEAISITCKKWCNLTDQNGTTAARVGALAIFGRTARAQFLLGLVQGFFFVGAAGRLLPARLT